ncbi:MAG TPA: DUF1223 domain-containing protein [Afifellaceae bacterium]|nr:DUF1223 domain-containing protein [Afifellaceae bacterium]
MAGAPSFKAMKATQALIALALGVGLAEVALAGPKAVVELFTSQGCSSCPPADAFLTELAERDDVIALSLHVDYWDYLGWKDTFGLAENTARQYAYGKARDDGKVYTPQMVVNGGGDFVGSNREAVEQALEAAALPVEVSLSRSAGAIEIAIGAAPDGEPMPGKVTVRLVVYDPAATVVIERGENKGRTASYRNVVESMRPIGMWKGERLEISLPADEVLHGEANEDYGCAVIVQEDLPGGPGRILGAGRL